MRTFFQPSLHSGMKCMAAVHDSISPYFRQEMFQTSSSYINACSPYLSILLLHMHMSLVPCWRWEGETLPLFVILVNDEISALISGNLMPSFAWSILPFKSAIHTRVNKVKLFLSLQSLRDKQRLLSVILHNLWETHIEISVLAPSLPSWYFLFLDINFQTTKIISLDVHFVFSNLSYKNSNSLF